MHSRRKVRNDKPLVCGILFFMKIILKSKTYGFKEVEYDDDDHSLVKGYTWHITKGKHTYYVMGHNPDTNHRLFMHRLILGAKRCQMVDHKDGNGLNNKKDNIRIATPAENARNKRSIRKPKSGYKGVSIMPDRKRMYMVQIGYNYGYIPLGYFADIILAALAYNEAAIKYHGEFAQLNALTQEQIDYANSIRNIKGMISVPRSNKNGHPGIYKRMDTIKERYDVKIRINGRRKFIGGFDSIEQAAQAYQNALKEYKKL